MLLKTIWSAPGVEASISVELLRAQMSQKTPPSSSIEIGLTGEQIDRRPGTETKNEGFQGFACRWFKTKAFWGFSLFHRSHRVSRNRSMVCHRPNLGQVGTSKRQKVGERRDRLVNTCKISCCSQQLLPFVFACPGDSVCCLRRKRLVQLGK